MPTCPAIDFTHRCDRAPHRPVIEIVQAALPEGAAASAPSGPDRRR